MVASEHSTGVTPSEQYLGKLCRSSFLTLWSYQNIYTDRGTTERNKQGKELCDLLVVFENDIIIFSDKSCAMPNTGRVDVDWARWYRRAIANSVDQIFGAERWIENYPDRIFTDKFCQNRFPLVLPALPQRRIHRVVVALGSGERTEQFFGGNSRGSLMLASWIRGVAAHTAPGDEFRPFTFGWVDDSKRFVHVLDDVTLNLIMNELDTISDFVQYLNAKEGLFSLPNKVLCAGEEDLLGFYLTNLDDDGSFIPPEIQEAMKDPMLMVHIAEGIWDDYSTGPIAEIRREIKRSGKLIDGIIENMSRHVLDGTLAYGNEDGFLSHEQNLRFLAAEPRLNRALLATAMAQKLTTTPNNAQTSILLRSSRPDRIFIFLLFPRSAVERQKSYRRERQAAMTLYCHVAKHMNPDVRYVICLATEPGSPSRRRSEDLISFDFEGWTPEADEEAAKVQKELNILTNFTERRLSDPPITRRGDLHGNRHQRRKDKAKSRKR